MFRRVSPYRLDRPVTFCVGGKSKHGKADVSEYVLIYHISAEFLSQIDLRKVVSSLCLFPFQSSDRSVQHPGQLMPHGYVTFNGQRELFHRPAAVMLQRTDNVHALLAISLH